MAPVRCRCTKLGGSSLIGGFSLIHCLLAALSSQLWNPCQGIPSRNAIVTTDSLVMSGYPLPRSVPHRTYRRSKVTSETRTRLRNFIGGEYVDSKDGRTSQVIYPSTRAGYPAAPA